MGACKPINWGPPELEDYRDRLATLDALFREKLRHLKTFDPDWRSKTSELLKLVLGKSGK